MLYLALTLGLATALGLPAGAAPPAPPAASATSENPAAHAHFTDVVLHDHDGRPRRLYSDLVRGKVVVVNSFYASCIESCPIVMGAMKRIQDELGDRLGRDVHLLSLTVDPAADTPARLGDYATRLGVRPGWFLLSGDPVNVHLALRKLGHATRTKEAHVNLLTIGNDRTGLWKKAMALAAPDALVRLVQGVIEDR